MFSPLGYLPLRLRRRAVVPGRGGLTFLQWEPSKGYRHQLFRPRRDEWIAYVFLAIQKEQGAHRSVVPPL